MTESQFRMAVGTSFLLGFGSIAALFLFNSTLPTTLDQWVAEQPYDIFAPFELLTIALFLTYLVGSIGLLFFTRWSRALYASGILGVTLATLFSGPSVATALESFLTELTVLADGFILALAYFSDARHHFKGQPQTSVTLAT